MPVGAAILLAISPFLPWAQVPSMVVESGSTVRTFDGKLDLFDMASVHSRFFAWIPLLLAAFALHEAVRSAATARRLIFGGVLIAIVNVVLYFTLLYTINELYSNAAQISYGLFVAFAGSAILIGDGVRIWHRGDADNASIEAAA
jgi:hypothetical protein